MVSVQSWGVGGHPRRLLTLRYMDSDQLPLNKAAKEAALSGEVKFQHRQDVKKIFNDEVKKREQSICYESGRHYKGLG